MGAVAVTPPSIRQQLDALKQYDYLSVRQCALLMSCHPNTIRRRLPALREDILRHGRVLRIRRVALMKLFRAEQLAAARLTP